MNKDILILIGIGAGIYFLSKQKSVTGINGTRVDLFEDYENIPPKIKKILDNYEDAFIDGDYKQLTEALNLVRKNGYTFEFYLDGQAYGLRPKNIALKNLKGYEDIGYNKSKAVSKVLQLMDQDYSYSQAIKIVLNENKKLSKKNLEKELNKYI